MKSNMLIDWLAVSYRWESVPERLREASFRGAEGLLGWLGVKPSLEAPVTLERARYGFSYAVKCGAVILYLSEVGSSQGLHIVRPGSSLNDEIARTALAHMTENGGACSRIDIAVDARDSSLTPERLAALYVVGEYEGRQRSHALMTGSKGATLYIGSRASEQYMRIYDKAAQMGIEGRWTRIELELKGDTARVWARRLHERITMIPSILQSFVNFYTYSDWKEAMQGAVAEKWKGEKKMTDRVKWLMNVIAPLLAELQCTNPAAYAAFTAEQQRLFDEMIDAAEFDS